MAGQLTPITDYYRIVLASNGTGGPFQFSVLLRIENTYNGDGTEFGPSALPGDRQIYRVAKGLATGFEQAGKPGWDNITVVSINGNVHQQSNITAPVVP